MYPPGERPREHPGELGEHQDEIHSEQVWIDRSLDNFNQKIQFHLQSTDVLLIIESLQENWENWENARRTRRTRRTQGEDFPNSRPNLMVKICKYRVLKSNLRGERPGERRRTEENGGERRRTGENGGILGEPPEDRW